MKLGYALIPSDPIFSSLIQSQNRISSSYLFLDDLGSQTNLPHISLFLGDFHNDVPYRSIATKLVQEYHVHPFKLTLVHIDYKPYGWYYWYTDRPKELLSLHQSCCVLNSPYLTYASKEWQLRYSGIDHLSEAEIQSIHTFGSRYWGDAYRPHITIGRNQDETRNEKIGKEIEKDFEGLDKTFRPAYLTVFEITPNHGYGKTLYREKLIG